MRRRDTVGSLGLDEGVCFVCGCRERTFSRAELVERVGEDAPLHMLGLRFRCTRCGERPKDGWITWEGKRRFERREEGQARRSLLDPSCAGR